jgi:hypothetical protein
MSPLTLKIKLDLGKLFFSFWFKEIDFFADTFAFSKLGISICYKANQTV